MERYREEGRVADEDGEVVESKLYPRLIASVVNDPDAQFIADAPTLVADLVAEVERLTNDNDMLKTTAGWSVYFEQKAKPLREEIERLRPYEEAMNRHGFKP